MAIHAVINSMPITGVEDYPVRSAVCGDKEFLCIVKATDMFSFDCK